MGFDKKLSLIIPVYNKAKYLKECFRSIASQGLNEGEFEVLLVNDGSTDNSLDICKQFASELSYVKVIDKKNGGVSSARNAGIRAAKGKYIAFLDADDSLTPGSLQAIVNAFERYHDKVDVMAYHLKYIYPQKGTESYNKRDRWFKETGVYLLSEYPYLCQTTMNIVVKNQFAESLLFDEALKEGEDQHYVTRNLVSKCAIGYCAEAEYRYIRDGSGASEISNNPLYAYDDMIKLFGFFIDAAINQTPMASYAYQILLYNVAWRLRGNELYPYHFSGQEFAEQKNRLVELLKQIPIREYARTPFLGGRLKAYLIHLCNPNEESLVSYAGKKPEISFPSINYSWKVAAPRLDFLRFIQKENSFEIVLRLGCSLFLFDADISLEIGIGSSWRPVELSGSSYDFWQSHERTAKYFTATIIVPFSELGRRNTLSFRCLDSRKNTIKSLNIAFDRNVYYLRSNSFVWNDSWVFPDYCVELAEKKLNFKKIGFLGQQKFARRIAKVDKTLFDLRKHIREDLKEYRNTPVWMYSDTPFLPDEGNALVQLLHDLKKNDGRNRFYVSNYGSELVKSYPELNGRIVEFESKEHNLVSLAAQCMIVSSKETSICFPYAKEFFNKIGDLARNKHVVYVTNGLLWAYMPWRYGFGRTFFDSVVVSTDAEYNAWIDSYAYPKEALLKTGMPRFDKYANRQFSKTKKIALIPSWRSYLVSGDPGNRITNEGLFIKSSFFQGMSNFLNKLDQSHILNKYGYSLDLKLPPDFRSYSQVFKDNFPWVNVVLGEIDETEYPVAITDFSSYICDFIYAGAYAFRYVPDGAEFRSGLHYYRKLEASVENLLPCIENPMEAVSCLEEILTSINQVGVPMHQSFTDDYFLSKDGRNCERLYNELGV